EIKGIKQKKFEQCQLLLIGLYNPVPDMPEAIKWVRRFNRYLHKLSEPGIRVVTGVFERFESRESELLSDDMVHPNRKGYREIARELIKSDSQLESTYALA